MAVSDINLLALRNGDEKVFESLFKTYYSPLCQYAFTLLKDKEESEEVVQGVFYSFWEKKDHVEIKSSLKAYLYKMVYHLSLNKLKHQKVKEVYLDYNATQMEQNYASATDLATENELKAKIDEALESLPEQCRLVFRLSRFEELKYAEIAEHLGISIKTVENQMGKALKILRIKLSEFLVLVIIVWTL